MYKSFQLAFFFKCFYSYLVHRNGCSKRISRYYPNTLTSERSITQTKYFFVTNALFRFKYVHTYVVSVHTQCTLSLIWFIELRLYEFGMKLGSVLTIAGKYDVNEKTGKWRKRNKISKNTRYWRCQNHRH